MTDQVELPEPDWSGATEAWANATPATPVPAVQVQPAVYDLADHVYTLSISPNKPPMLVIRAMGAAELKARMEECADEGVWTQIAEAQALANGSKPAADTIMHQLGATPVTPAGYPTAPQAYPAAPPMPTPAPPPFGAPPLPAQQAAAAWGAGAASVQAPPGWYRVKIPFQQLEAGKALHAQMKAQNIYQGNVKWDKDTKTWLVSPTVVGYYQQWGPTPA